MKSRLLAVLLCAAVPLPAAGGELTVAAAADTRFALGEIAAGFHKQTGNVVRLTFGSSGNFSAQIANGAPFDVFLSADVDYAAKLLATGAAEPGSLRRYAQGKLVLWAPRDSRLNLQLGMQVLVDPAVRKIAIANPAHAPYGRAAVAALRHHRLYEQVGDRLVLGEDVSQAAQFVQSGNAQAGLIPLSLALAPTMQDKGKFWELPAADYPPLVQAAVIVSSSRQKKLAAAFLDYLTSSEAVAVLRRYGFAPPGGAQP